MKSRPACLDLDPVEADKLFFNRNHVTQARAICARCPAAMECLDAVMAAEGQDCAGYRFGVFAATLPEQRAAAVGASAYRLGR